jgi:hypothetical protein
MIREKETQKRDSYSKKKIGILKMKMSKNKIKPQWKVRERISWMENKAEIVI